MCSDPGQVQGPPPQVEAPAGVTISGSSCVFLRIFGVTLLLPCRLTHLWNGSRHLCSSSTGEERPTLQQVAENIRERRYRRVVVMAGAGISTPSGIPDFR